jgi:hypothetical protein
MLKIGSWAIVCLVLCIPLLYGGHLLANYQGIQKGVAQKSAKTLIPSVDDGDASDIGYIYNMRRETRIREGKLILVWFVVIPATNVHYSCSYDSGFSDFKIGDSVRLIHTKSEDAGDYGYMIGLHDKEQGKVTSIWNFNMDAEDAAP